MTQLKKEAFNLRFQQRHPANWNTARMRTRQAGETARVLRSSTKRQWRSRGGQLMPKRILQSTVTFGRQRQTVTIPGRASLQAPGSGRRRSGSRKKYRAH